MAILLFFCLLFTILSIRMYAFEQIETNISNWVHWFIYIPTCILWSIFYYLS